MYVLFVSCDASFRVLAEQQQTKKKPNKTATNVTGKRPQAATSNATITPITSTTIENSSNKTAVITKNTSNETKNQNRNKKVAATSQTPTIGFEVSMNGMNSNGNANQAARMSAKPAKKVNKTSEMLETISNTTVNTKLDEVLKTVRQLDNTCDFGRCRTKTSLIFQDCTLCQQRFCMKHQLPEIHGCGGAIKKEQRTEFLKPRPTLPISAALRRNEQKDAHSRLEQKLKEMSLARQKARK